jgi:superfamily I DNA/RNA helicase
MQNTNISGITSISELESLMKDNACDAESLYKKAIELKCQNEQFFLDWQDCLNAVSITKLEDA